MKRLLLVLAGALVVSVAVAAPFASRVANTAKQTRDTNLRRVEMAYLRQVIAIERTYLNHLRAVRTGLGKTNQKAVDEIEKLDTAIRETANAIAAAEDRLNELLGKPAVKRNYGYLAKVTIDRGNRPSLDLAALKAKVPVFSQQTDKGKKIPYHFTNVPKEIKGLTIVQSVAGSPGAIVVKASATGYLLYLIDSRIKPVWETKTWKPAGIQATVLRNARYVKYNVYWTVMKAGEETQIHCGPSQILVGDLSFAKPTP